MLRKAYTPLSMLAKGILMLALGILFYTRPEGTLRMAVSLVNVLVWLSTVDSLIKWIVKRGDDRPALGKAILLVALAIFLSTHPNSLPISLSILFGIWILINAIGKFLYAVQLWQTKSRGKFKTLFEGVIFTLFSVSLFTSPVEGAASLTSWLGLYCLVSGFFLLIDARREWLGTDIKGKRIRQRMRIKPPVLLTSLMPMNLLRILDDPDEEAEIAQWTRKETILPDAKPDLMIFLHLSKNTAMGFGHMDIALDGTVYSYGNYNAASTRLFGILSDGVLVKTDLNAYIPFCLQYEKKRLIGYGVILTAEQKASIHRKIDNFLGESTRCIRRRKRRSKWSWSAWPTRSSTKSAMARSKPTTS